MTPAGTSNELDVQNGWEENTHTLCMVIPGMYGDHKWQGKGKGQPGKVANLARGEAEQGKRFFPCARSRQRTSSRETSSAVPSRVSLFIFILRLNLMLTYYGIPPEVRCGVYFLFNHHTTSGQSQAYRAVTQLIAYRLRSLPRVRRYRASKPP